MIGMCLICLFVERLSLIRLVGFVMRRYESDHPIPSSALYAWQLLGNSVYLNNPSGDRSVMLGRPSISNGQDVSFVDVLHIVYYCMSLIHRLISI